jgi:hypothetical protein
MAEGQFRVSRLATLDRGFDSALGLGAAHIAHQYELTAGAEYMSLDLCNGDEAACHSADNKESQTFHWQASVGSDSQFSQQLPGVGALNQTKCMDDVLPDTFVGETSLLATQRDCPGRKRSASV